MKRLTLVFIFVIVGVASFFIFIKLNKKSVLEEESMPKNSLEGKKAVIVVASRDFRDPEYFIPKGILEKVGFKVKTASDKPGMALGADGEKAKIDLLLKQVAVDDFDVVVFIGGPGALKHLDNEESYRIAKETVLKGKILASICISPVVLAKAGILKGKRATVWSSPMNKKPILELENNGALYEKGPVVIDGSIITANGPQAAEAFGKAIIDILK